MPMTRRLFGLSLAGISSAWGTTTGFVKHSVFKRPYVHAEFVASRALMLFDCIHLQVECSAPLRINVTQEGLPEPILQTSVVPRNREIFRFLGVHGFPVRGYYDHDRQSSAV